MAMPSILSDQPLVPSLLDRLLDDDPTQTREPMKARHQVLREMKLSLRRDLENLLNTRRRAGSRPPHLTELERSLVNYGIPDITGMDVNSSDVREQLRGVIETAVREFDPRFKSVRVEMLPPAEGAERTLRFRIDAVVYAAPAFEEVVFDSSWEPISGEIEVKGAAR
jgi:type VI secretion system protein ImpF